MNATAVRSARRARAAPLPRRFKDKLANIAVVVEGWPDAETLADLEIEPPDTLYGLYRGVDLTHRDSSYVTCCRTRSRSTRAHREDAYDEQEMTRDGCARRSCTRSGHYFGLDDETMHRIEDE